MQGGNTEINQCTKKNNKSPGIDKVLNNYIKCTNTKMVPVYVQVFNIILNTGIIPDNWAKDIIIPIYKNKGSSLDPKNYRPITLLSCISKRFTAILNDRLTQFFQENHILNENKAGFRKNYSPTDHIFTLNSFKTPQKEIILHIHRLFKSL